MRDLAARRCHARFTVRGLSGGRRRRGSRGHPARVAQREREQPRRGPVSEEVRVARMIAQSAAEVDSALDAEAWASHLLGTFREQRHGLPFPDAFEVDPALLFGEPLVTRLGTFDDPAATVALAAIAALDDGELGALAAELLAGLTPAAVPRRGSSRSASRRSSAPR